VLARSQAPFVAAGSAAETILRLIGQGRGLSSEAARAGENGAALPGRKSFHTRYSGRMAAAAPGDSERPSSEGARLLFCPLDKRP
jgi:hypothetical protein